MGNVPGGHFLVGSTSSDAVLDINSIKWKRATRAQAEAKVHSAFLAAGYFLVAKADMFRKHDDIMQQQMQQPKNQPADCQHDKDNDIQDATSDSTIATSSSYHDSIVSSNASESDATEEKPTSKMTSLTIPCPVRIREFVQQPVSKYFVPDVPKDDDECNATLFSPKTNTSTDYLIPSAYDVLCGTGQNFFHHIGNRRFRIMIEMNVERYRKLLEPPQDTNPSNHSNDQGMNTEDQDTVEHLISETLVSLSKCNPPGRFLGMDLSTGKWRVLNPKFAALKTEQSYFECRKVQMQIEEKRRKMEEELLDRVAQVDLDATANAEKALVVATSQGHNSKVNASHTCNGHNMLCGVPPFPSFGVDISTMQTRARRMLRCTTRTLEYVEMIPSNGDLRTESNDDLRTESNGDLRTESNGYLRTELSKNNFSGLHQIAPLVSNLSQLNSEQRAVENPTQHGSQKIEVVPSLESNGSIRAVAGMLGLSNEANETISKHSSMVVDEMKPTKAPSLRVISKDIMDVVGGMLSLGAGGENRRSG